MAKPTKVEISLEMMQQLRDQASGGTADWAWFTIALGIAERLERIMELLESRGSN